MAAQGRYSEGRCLKTDLAGCVLRRNRGRVNIGFMGGSFDPVHIGHLIAAQDAYEQMGLDRLMFVPAAQTPLKSGPTQASADHRMMMIQQAVAGDRRFAVSDFELRKGGISYTVESARHFRSMYPSDELYWVIGSDQLPAMHLWKDIDELSEMVQFIVLERPGFPQEYVESRQPGLRIHRCTSRLIELSSTEIRNRAARGLPLEYLVPSKAVVYIEEHNLYR